MKHLPDDRNEENCVSEILIFASADIFTVFVVLLIYISYIFVIFKNVCI